MSEGPLQDNAHVDQQYNEEGHILECVNSLTECQYWTKVLKRVVADVKFLSEHWLVFRGHTHIWVARLRQLFGVFRIDQSSRTILERPHCTFWECRQGDSIISSHNTL